MGKATLPIDPTRSIPSNYASGCCSVILATLRSIQEWTFMDESPHLIIGYRLRDES